MKKWVIVLIVIGALGAIALPVTNLMVALPDSRLAELQTDDAERAHVMDILNQKCVHCHTRQVKLPWYANFPVAKQLMTHDITEGTKHLDYVAAFDNDGGPVPEVALAKTEYTTRRNEMPPPQYMLMHWNHGLTSEEEQAILDWIAKERKSHYAPDSAPENVQAMVLHPVPPTMAVDARKVILGNKLFHDPRLSKDDTISCASCHDLAKGGTDQAAVATGVGGAKGPINSPTVYNSVFNFAQFWDGRAADLAEQADGPVNNPLEMASNWDEATAKLVQDEALTAAFLAVYPEGYSKETCTDAIAEFEKTLVTPNSAFDKWLTGDKAAMDEAAVAGYHLFMDMRCANCHVGKALGGQSYELMGARKEYFAGLDRELTEADDGRFNVTKDEYDRHRFKVPLLRNIALTFPYFHDAATSDLKEAVVIMAEYNSGEALSDEEAAQIVAFLEANTGEYQGKKL